MITFELCREPLRTSGVIAGVRRRPLKFRINSRVILRVQTAAHTYNIDITRYFLVIGGHPSAMPN